jgi:hypothetical protein
MNGEICVKIIPLGTYYTVYSATGIVSYDGKQALLKYVCLLSHTHTLDCTFTYLRRCNVYIVNTFDCGSTCLQEGHEGGGGGAGVAPVWIWNTAWVGLG